MVGIQIEKTNHKNVYEIKFPESYSRFELYAVIIKLKREWKRHGYLIKDWQIEKGKTINDKHNKIYVKVGER